MGFFDDLLKRSYHTNQPQFDSLIREYQAMGFEQIYITKALQQCQYNLTLFHDELIKVSAEEDAKKFSHEDLLTSQYKLKSNLQKKEENDIKRAIQISLDDDRPLSNEDLKDIIRKNDQKPVGLKNLGNTCYMNVMLQTLLNMKEFRKLILSVEIDSNTNDSGKLTIIRLQELISVMVQGKREYVSPLAFFEAMAKFQPSTMLVKGVQNDYYELWAAFLDAIEQGLKQVFKQTPLEPIEDVVIIEQLQQPVHEVIKQLQSIFYGRAEESLIYQEGDNEIIRQSITQFGVINLDSKDGELYKAFRNCQSLQIDEFMADDGSKTQANIDIKILEPPKVISFYVNRVNYDPKLKKVCKNNGVFQFQDRINLDSFYKNPEKTTEYNKTVQDKLEQLVLDEIKCQDSFNQFEDQQNPEAAQSFDQVINLIKTMEKSYDRKLSSEDFILCDKDLSVSSEIIESSQMMTQLDQYKKMYSKKREELSQNLKDMQKEKKALLDQKQNVYCLTSVIIHDGTAESGHYTCFIFDKKNQQWLKCNDRETTYVDYDIVQKTATGRLGATRNVSGLVYEEQNWMMQSEQTDILPPNLLSFVKQENQTILKQIDEQVMEKARGCIQQRMKQKEQQTQTLMRSSDKQDEFCNIVLCFSTLDTFMLNQNSPLFQYHLLNLALEIESSDLKQKLHYPENFEQYTKTFIANNAARLSIEGKPQELSKKYDELKNLYFNIASVLNQFTQQMEDIISPQNYNQQLVLYIQTLNSLCVKAQDYQGQAIIQRLKIKLTKLVGSILLKGCFFVDYLTQKADSTLIQQIENVTHGTESVFELSQAIKTQIQSNLNFTINRIRDSQIPIDQITLTSLINRIQNLTQTRTLQQDLSPFNKQELNDRVDVKQLVEKYLKITSSQLQVWLDMVVKIEKQSKQQQLSQSDRLNIEELLYFEIPQ